MIFLFDIDGTLIRSDGAGRRSFERACDEHLGVDGALGDIRLDGKTDPAILDEVFSVHRGRAATTAERTAILDRYLGYLETVLPTARYEVLPGVEAVLDHLDAAGAVLGLATGNLERGAEIKLRRGDLWRRFRFGGYGSDHAERAELVRIGIQRGRALAPRPVEDREIWVIGDTPRDIAAAHAAGCLALGVATGSYSEAELAASGADATTDTLVSWLDRRLSA